MNFLSSILGVLGGGLNSLFGLVTSTMQSGFKSAIQFHKEGIAFARDVGLSARQAQAYTNVLIERTQVLANKYGVSAEAIMQVQRGLSEATGKQLMLNDAQAESFVQIDKMMGAQNRAKFTEEIMNGMGGQVDTVQNAMAKVYATAAKQGLTAKKLTDKVAQNLSMANRLSFRNGIDGITRMAALSEKLGINMQSVETAAGQFMELDEAIENAAHMQMLGGSAAANFGNPLTAAYEANYDPEAFAKRMSDSLASYATFDASKGVASINGMNMDFVRNIAKTMGISVDDASKMAKKQAEVKYKEAQFTPQLNGLGLTEDQKNFIINNAQVTNGGKDLQLKGMSMSDLAANPKKLQEMMDFEGMSDKDILAKQASTLTSIDQRLEGASATVVASFAEGVSPYITEIGEKIQGLGSFFSEYAKVWGADTGQVVGKAMDWINQHGDSIANVASNILNGITKVIDFLSGGGLYRILAAVIGYKALKGILGMSVGNGGTIGGRAAKSVISNLKNPAVLGKVAKGGGVGIAGILGNIAADHLVESGKIEKGGTAHTALKVGSTAAEYGGLGAMIGSVVPVIGTGVGAAIGGTIGAVKGGYDTWKSLPENADKGFFDFVGEQFNNLKDFTIKHFSPIIEGARSAFNSISKAITPIINGISNAVSKVFGGIWKQVQDIWGYAEPVLGEITNLINTVFGGIFTTLSVWWDNIISPIIEKATPIVSTLFDKIGGFFGGVWKIVSPILEATFNTVKVGFKFLGGFFESIFGLLQGNTEPIKRNFKAMIDWFKDLPGVIYDWIRSKIPEWAGGISEEEYKSKQEARAKAKAEKHAEGGFVGGFITEGAIGVEHPIPYAQKGEVILNPTQQKNFMALANDSTVRAKEYGAEREYIYKPNGTETSNVNGNTITVKDFNINLSGTLRLDGGNYSKNIDMNALLNDYQFMNALKEMIKTSINNDMNGGRFMNDLAARRGQVSSSSIIGR